MLIFYIIAKLTRETGKGTLGVKLESVFRWHMVYYVYKTNQITAAFSLVSKTHL
jgi:hypothetical protein